MSNNLTESEIDDLVIAEVDDDGSWEKPVFVNRKKIFSLVSTIGVDSEILSGKPVFEGTRVPVSTLLDNLASGTSLDEFLDNFPTVKREQAIRVLEFFKASLEGVKQAA